MSDLADRSESIIRRLRGQGHRLTPQRMAILQAVLESSSHPTAEDVHQRVTADFPMISLATVYKTLHVLKDLGEVVELKMDGRNRFDSNVAPHPHLICVQCQGIADLWPETTVTIPEHVLAGTGFRALRYEIGVHGVCRQRQTEAEEP